MWAFGDEFYRLLTMCMYMYMYVTATQEQGMQNPDINLYLNIKPGDKVIVK